MILTGHEIMNQMDKGNIVIEPFDKSQLNPNSYNLRLGNTMREVIPNKGEFSDFGEPGKSVEIFPDSNGKFFLEPMVPYLAITEEVIFTDKFVPMIDGRSSGGRHFLFVHITAGFGDCGFKGRFVLEVLSVTGGWLTPGQQICQVSFQELVGEREQYHGRYNAQMQIVDSKGLT